MNALIKNNKFKHSFFLLLRYFLICFTLLIFFSFIFFSIQVYGKIQSAKVEQLNTLSYIENILNHLGNKAKILEYYIKALGSHKMQQILNEKDNIDPNNLKNFNAIAKSLKNLKAIRSIQLLPNGITYYIYPLKGNEKAFGHDILHSANRVADALKAKKEKRLIVSGPLTLVQGGQALIVRNPIYFQNGQFWGFSVVIFDIPAILEPFGLKHLTTCGYEYRLIWNKSPNENIVIGSTFKHDHFYTSKTTLNVLDKQWTLEIAPINDWIPSYEILIALLIIIILSTYFAILLTSNKLTANLLKVSLQKECEIRKAATIAYNEAMEANIAKSKFLSTMSHDIRTPMNAIVGLCSLLEQNRFNAIKSRQYIDKITASSRHLLSLINDILYMSRIDSKKIQPHIIKVELATIINELYFNINENIDIKDKKFSITTNDIIHGHLVTDKLRISQILLNVLANAFKYTKQDGQISLNIKELNQRLIDNNLFADYQFTITDNGVGISSDFIDHIFEPFAREKDPRTDSIPGAGLGMAITHSLVNLLKGTINVQSKLNEGTTFSITLPIQILNNQNDLLFFKKCQINNILTITDKEEDYQNIVQAFKETEVLIDNASSKEDLEDKLNKACSNNSPYKCILIDLNNKQANNDAFACLMNQREMLKKLPIFVYSDFEIEVLEDKTRDMKVTDFIVKPFFLSNLIDALKKFYKKIDLGLDVNIPSNKDMLQGKNILIAEDNDLNADILVELLKIQGAKATVYKNGKELIEAFKQCDDYAYDLILMDVKMPVMDGLEATRQIRAMKRGYAQQIMIIAMTANTFAEDIKNSLDAGMNYHLIKPINIEELKTIIKNNYFLM